MRVAVVPVLLTLLLAGCGAGASSTAVATQDPAEATVSARPPSSSPEQTPGATAMPTDTAAPVQPAPTLRFTLTSPGFADGGAIPLVYSCDGRDVSPPLAWAGVPAGATALLLTVTDPDARGFVHWVAWDLAPDLAALSEGASGSLRGRAAEGRNDFGRTGWGGPCPPSGTHRYVFTLTALSGPLGLPRGTELATVQRRAAAVTLGKTELVGTYRR